MNENKQLVSHSLKIVIGNYSNNDNGLLMCLLS